MGFRRATLVFLRRGGEVLLIEKKRGIGAGFFNGPGGKIEEGEGAAESAAREVSEEVGMTVKPADLEECGRCLFYFAGEPFMDVEIFSSREFSGEPVETAEAVPVWTKEGEMPFDRMWPDDRIWVPLMLSGKRFSGKFFFGADNKTLVSHEISVVPGD